MEWIIILIVTVIILGVIIYIFYKKRHDKLGNYDTDADIDPEIFIDMMD